jgi:hypothetical protein
VPRLINTLCDTAMLAAFALDREVVGREEIAGAIEELQWVEYAQRPHMRQAAAPEAAVAPRPPPPVASGPPLARISLAFDGQDVEARELHTGRIVIGRTPDNDLQIDSKFVSRHHAQIITTRNTSVLEDLNSTNGVYVEAKRVRRRLLNDGDVVQIGRHEILYRDQRQSRHGSGEDHDAARDLPGHSRTEAASVINDPDLALQKS